MLLKYGIENVEREVKDYWENELSQESQITNRLPRNGQTTKKKYTCKTLLVRNCGLHPLIHTFDRTQSGTRYCLLPNALHALHAMHWFSKNGARLVEHFPAPAHRPKGGRTPFKNPGSREIIFVDSRSSYGEDRRDRSAFKPSQRWGKARYSSR